MLGNTHTADHTILVPVFIDGEHLFTASAKAHQADCGNAEPSTYVTYVEDVYAEGGLVFPCVKVQEHYQDIEDIIRMCRRRIRVPEVWYGDYLAAVGAARIGERRLQDVIARYGVARIRAVRHRLARLLRAQHGAGDPQAPRAAAAGTLAP